MNSEEQELREDLFEFLSSSGPVDGSLIKALRERYELTGDAVGAEIGVTRAAVNNAERRTIGRRTAKRYVDAIFGIVSREDRSLQKHVGEARS